MSLENFAPKLLMIIFGRSECFCADVLSAVIRFTDNLCRCHQRTVIKVLLGSGEMETNAKLIFSLIGSTDCKIAFLRKHFLARHNSSPSTFGFVRCDSRLTDYLRRY